jgi:DHA1 family multidrug resistance protein B-like MFS transporter
MVFITVGENLTTPGMNTVVSRIAPAGKTGRYMGFLSMANSGGRAVGPSIGSFLMFFFAYRGLEVWGSIASLGLISISLLAIFYFSVYRSYVSNGSDTV